MVLFTWVQFLKEEALRFLDVHTLLELPCDEPSTQDSGCRTCNVPDPREPDPSAPSLDVEGPTGILADEQNPAAFDCNQISHASYVREAEQTLQTSEFKADPSSPAGKSKRPPSAQSDQSSKEDFLNEGNVSASLLPPSSSSSPLHQSERGAASLTGRPREPLSGLSLTPSQILLSQLLIHDAAHKQKVFATTVFDCSVCFVGWLGSDCVLLPECGHIFCRACLAVFCKLQITEGNVQGVTCPQADCTATPTPAQVQS